MACTAAADNDADDTERLGHVIRMARQHMAEVHGMPAAAAADDGITSERAQDELELGATAASVVPDAQTPPPPCGNTQATISGTQPRNEKFYENVEVGTAAIPGKYMQKLMEMSPDDMEKEFVKLRKKYAENVAVKNETNAFVDEVLEKCVSDNGGYFLLNSPMGQRFNRFLKSNVQETKNHDGLADDERKEFQKKWAMAKFDKLRESKTYKEVHETTGQKKGVYRPLGVIVKKEGGWNDPEAVKGSFLLAAKCVLMGSPWVEMNPFTERVEFLHMERSTIDTFKKHWATHVDWGLNRECCKFCNPYTQIYWELVVVVLLKKLDL